MAFQAFIAASLVATISAASLVNGVDNTPLFTCARHCTYSYAGCMQARSNLLDDCSQTLDRCYGTCFGGFQATLGAVVADERETETASDNRPVPRADNEEADSLVNALLKLLKQKREDRKSDEEVHSAREKRACLSDCSGIRDMCSSVAPDFSGSFTCRKAFLACSAQC